MNKLLEILRGHKLMERVFVEDYVQLKFSDGSILNVYNASNLHEIPDEDLIGSIIVNSLIDNDSLIIELNSNAIVRINMNDDAYSGPEALSFFGPNGEVIVWN